MGTVGPSRALPGPHGSVRARRRTHAAFLAGLPVSLTTPRERPGRPVLAFRFFSLQRSRGLTHPTPPFPNFLPPPCTHHSLSPWTLSSHSSGSRRGLCRLVKSETARKWPSPIISIEHMQSPVHAIGARSPPRRPLGPTSLDRKAQKDARKSTLEGGGLEPQAPLGMDPRTPE